MTLHTAPGAAAGFRLLLMAVMLLPRPDSAAVLPGNALAGVELHPSPEQLLLGTGLH